jgi:glycosyl hydrolase family 113/F5/8 type C domain-containing protein
MADVAFHELGVDVFSGRPRDGTIRKCLVMLCPRSLNNRCIWSSKMHLMFSRLALIFLAFSACADEVYLPAQGAEVSSFDDTPGWAPPKNSKALIDGDLKTRWASASADTKSGVTLNLGREAVISSVAVNWERAFAREFNILISTDAKTFKPVASVKDGKGYRQVVQISPVTTAHWIRIETVAKVNPEWGISIWEVEVYGPAAQNPENKPLKDIYPKLAAQIAAPKELVREKPLGKAGDITLLEFQKGVVLASYSDTELAGPECDQTLKYLASIGVGEISLIVTWYQEKQDSEKISAVMEGGNTARDEAVIHAINEAHKNGIKVMLKPHVDCLDTTFRGDLVPTEAWFKSYQDFIMHYAVLSQEFHVELFSIGCELENCSYDQWKKQWDDLIVAVRKVYTGKLTYAANWTEYETVCFWDKMDFIGIDAYFPVTNKRDPTQEEMNKGWRANIEKIAAWRTNKKLVQPLIFTEIGYQSADSTNVTPWQTGSTKEDQEEQAMALEAMLQATQNQPWFKGFYWWNYFPTDVQRPLDFTIKGKKAEQMLMKWFKKTQEGK